MFHLTVPRSSLEVQEVVVDGRGQVSTGPHGGQNTVEQRQHLHTLHRRAGAAGQGVRRRLPRLRPQTPLSEESGQRYGPSREPVRQDWSTTKI